MSYNGWTYNDWSNNDQSYNDYPINECSYGSYSDPYMIEENSNGETFKEEPFDRSGLKDLLQQFMQETQISFVEMNARIDGMYNDINSKLEVSYTHVEKLETKIARIAETQSLLEGATNAEESGDKSVSTPSQEICNDIMLELASEGQEKNDHEHLSWDTIDEYVNYWEE